MGDSNKIFFADYNVISGYISPVLSLETWHYVTLTYDGSSVRGYTDGGLYYSGSDTLATLNMPLIIGRICMNSAPGNFFDGSIDEVMIYNNSVENATSINNTYRNQVWTQGYGNVEANTSTEAPPVTPSTISFFNQTPSDITSTNLFNQRLNITYNVTATNLSEVYLNYTIRSNTQNCLIYENASCIQSNDTYKNITSISNNSGLYTFSPSENIILPGTYLYNETALEKKPKKQPDIKHKQRLHKHRNKKPHRPAIHLYRKLHNRQRRLLFLQLIL